MGVAFGHLLRLVSCQPLQLGIRDSPTEHAVVEVPPTMEGDVSQFPLGLGDLHSVQRFIKFSNNRFVIDRAAAAIGGKDKAG